MSMGRQARTRIAAITLGLGLVLLAATLVGRSAVAAPAGKPARQDQPTNDYCIGCHSQQGLS